MKQKWAYLFIGLLVLLFVLAAFRPLLFSPGTGQLTVQVERKASAAEIFTGSDNGCIVPQEDRAGS